MDKQLIIFDLDGTLAESKQPLSLHMAETLCNLLSVAEVAVISGASMDQFKHQFIAKLWCTNRFSHLHILPTNGASYFAYDALRDDWFMQYVHEIKEEDKEKIRQALREAIIESGVEMPKELFGEQLEDRRTQMTWSALGQRAPLDRKDLWDRDQVKRQKIKAILDAKLPEFQIGIGGLTSIDITQKGIDKGFAIKELMSKLGLPREKVLYVGDALFPGGNDYPAIKAHVDTLQVRDPDHTKEEIEKLLTKHK